MISSIDQTLPSPPPGEGPKYPKETTRIFILPGQEYKKLYGEYYYYSKGEYLTSGSTAIVERLPSGDVIKTPNPNPYCPPAERDHRRQMQHEAEIYQKLGEHALRIIEWDPEICCLTMEYLENGDLKTYVRKHHDTISSELRWRWAKQAAEDLRLLHSAGIIHCDISPRNFPLDRDLNLKICDFGGSSVSGSKPSAFADPRYRAHGDYDAAPRFEDDVFALGSLIYFFCTAEHPYGDVASDEVEMRYQSRQFPDVGHLIYGEVIRKCWHNQVDAAQLGNSFGDL